MQHTTLFKMTCFGGNIRDTVFLPISGTPFLKLMHLHISKKLENTQIHRKIISWFNAENKLRIE